MNDDTKRIAARHVLSQREQGLGVELSDVAVYRLKYDHNDEDARSMPNGFAAFLLGRHGSYYEITISRDDGRSNMEDLRLYEAIAPDDIAETREWVGAAIDKVRQGYDMSFKFEY